MPRVLGAAVAASVAVNGLFLSLRPRVPPSPSVIHLQAETAVETAALFGLGLRRLAADLELIRLIVYYGTPEEDEGGEHHHRHGFDPEHPERYWGGGAYKELGPRAMRIIDIDPSFNYGALYSAGALAFNLNRPDEAIEVLKYGLQRDPSNRKYQYYIGAVGFSRHGDMRKAAAALEPQLSDPECPTMVKSMVAYLYKRMGEKEKAIRLYREIAQTSRDWGYRTTAERMLAELER